MRELLTSTSPLTGRRRCAVARTTLPFSQPTCKIGVTSSLRLRADSAVEHALPWCLTGAGLVRVASQVRCK